MTQKRIHDYRGPRSSEDLNRKLVGIIPPGVYEGFAVHTDGTIDPGVLFTSDGVRIEEDDAVQTTWGPNWENLGLPPGDPTHPRRDLVVCQYQYETSVPAPEAHYRIIQGTPAVDPEYPDLPDHSILLARATMPQGGIEYSEVIQAGPPVGSVADLAGEGRTDETVMGNQAAIEDLAGEGRTTETVKGNSDDIADLAGEGHSTETVKGNADGLADLGSAVSDHFNATEGAHPASAVSVEDSGDNLNADDVESALAEILSAFSAGHYRQNETDHGKHRSIHLPCSTTSGQMTLLLATDNHPAGAIRFYAHTKAYTGGNGAEFFLTVNASYDNGSGQWSKDNDVSTASLFGMNNMSFVFWKRSGSGSFNWGDWEEAMFINLSDPGGPWASFLQSILFKDDGTNKLLEPYSDLGAKIGESSKRWAEAHVKELKSVEKIVGNSTKDIMVSLGTGKALRAHCLALGSADGSGPTWTRGTGAPSQSAEKGSLYSDTTYGKLYVNSDGTSSGWKEAQVV